MSAPKPHARDLQQIREPTLTSAREEFANKQPQNVATIEDLQLSISSGVHHIVIVDHIDLTTVPREELIPTRACPDGCGSPLPAIVTMRSIRVCPSQQPTVPPLAPAHLPPQGGCGEGGGGVLYSSAVRSP